MFYWPMYDYHITTEGDYKHISCTTTPGYLFYTPSVVVAQCDRQSYLSW